MIRVAILAAASLIALPASAAQIFSTGYDTPNGDGTASGGGRNYWDLSYALSGGSGCVQCDGAALTGGSGDLTDGFSTTARWDTVETVAGTGPYVGWYQPFTTNPTLTFYFGGSDTIDTVRIWLDNSGAGGVYGPQSILIDGLSQSYTLPAFGSVGFTDITGLSLTGGSHTIQFQQFSGAWVFVNEVEFFGTLGAVPEPSQWALMLGGFGLLGAALRRRKTSLGFAA